MQAKILHVIEDKEVRPVGGELARRVDTRIVAASNRDLLEMVRQGAFREDLYFRLSKFDIEVPPLRERREDIPRLIRYVMQNIAGAGKTPLALDPDAEEILSEYPWPGNVRNSRTSQPRYILADGGRITLSDLPPDIARGPPRTAASASPAAVCATKCATSRQMEPAHWRVTATAGRRRSGSKSGSPAARKLRGIQRAANTRRTINHKGISTMKLAPSLASAASLAVVWHSRRPCPGRAAELPAVRDGDASCPCCYGRDTGMRSAGRMGEIDQADSGRQAISISASPPQGKRRPSASAPYRRRPAEKPGGSAQMDCACRRARPTRELASPTSTASGIPSARQCGALRWIRAAADSSYLTAMEKLAAATATGNWDWQSTSGRPSSGTKNPQTRGIRQGAAATGWQPMSLPGRCATVSQKVGNNWSSKQ
jgi:hypothetical protein